MDLTIRQSADYQGNDWWDWSVWIDGPADLLDRIQYVEYTLHPSFPQPVRRIRNRATQFRLDTAGWGTFTIYARVVFNDGEDVRLEHELNLYYPDGRPTQA